MSVYVELYKKGDTILHRLDPRAKIFWFITFTTLTIIAKDPICLTGILLILALMGKISGLRFKDYKPYMIAFIPVAIIAFLIHAATYSNPARILPPGWQPYYIGWLIPKIGRFGPFMHISLELIIFVSAFLIRLPAMLVCVRNFLAITSIAELASGLTKLKVPPEFTMAISMAGGYVPETVRQINSVVEAQTARGWAFTVQSRNPIKRVKRYIPLIIPLLFRSVTRAEFLAAAITSRGFSYDPSHRTYVEEIKLEKRDYAFIAFCTALVIGVYTLNLDYTFTVSLVRGLII